MVFLSSSFSSLHATLMHFLGGKDDFGVFPPTCGRVVSGLRSTDFVFFPTWAGGGGIDRLAVGAPSKAASCSSSLNSSESEDELMVCESGAMMFDTSSAQLFCIKMLFESF